MKYVISSINSRNYHKYIEYICITKIEGNGGDEQQET